MLNIFKKKKEFYSLDKLLEKEAMYNIIYGGRNIGKSYEVKRHCLQEAYTNHRYFGLIFRRESDKKVAEIKAYFSDSPIGDITNGTADAINIRAGEIYFTKDNKKVQTCGYVFFLDEEEKYKSGTYDNVHNVIFEEFISRKGYLPGELEKLDSLISTVFRLRTDTRVFLIGNLISRVIPYRSGWGLTGLDKQREGTIDVYKKEFINPYRGCIEYIDIAVERAKSNDGTQTFALSKKGQDSAKGEWEVEDSLKISREELDKHYAMYQFVVTYGGFYFLLTLYKSNINDYFLYCERKTTNIQQGTRVIGDITSMSNLYTKNFTPLVDRERFIFKLIDQNKIYFCDDLTAADFKISVKSIIDQR